MVIVRNDKGELVINRFDVGVTMDEFFILAQPKNRQEAEWLYKQLQGLLENSYEGTLSEFDESK